MTTQYNNPMAGMQLDEPLSPERPGPLPPTGGLVMDGGGGISFGSDGGGKTKSAAEVGYDTGFVFNDGKNNHGEKRCASASVAFARTRTVYTR